MKNKLLILILTALSFNIRMDTMLAANNHTYYFPSEEDKHEGTWITWPHEHTYGKEYAKSVEYIWIEMTQALTPGERVHIIAYDQEHKTKILSLLKDKNINLNQIDFLIAPSNDVWTRDTGPLFAFDESNQLTIVDFGFDGWGKKMPYELDDSLPQAAASDRDYPIVDVNDFILEGGSVELDGNGTAMLTKSAVISKNRNPHMTQAQAEDYMRQYLGVTHFIWLEGVLNEDITDAHIDGFARFYKDSTILTVSEKEFYDLFENIKEEDYRTLKEATNAQGKPYNFVEIPLTQNNVKGLDYKGSYLNFYVGNQVVLVPIYDDPNDSLALKKISALYPERKIIPINVVPLYKNGGMIHCITQQEPAKRKN